MEKACKTAGFLLPPSRMPGWPPSPVRRPTDTLSPKGRGLWSRCFHAGAALRVNATQLHAEGHTIDGEHVRGNAVVDVMFLAVLDHAIECRDLNLPQLFVHIVFQPEIALPVLNPLEVGDGHTTGVGQNVRHDEHAAFEEDIVRRCGGGAVRPFHKDARLDSIRVPAGNHALFGGG